MSRAFLRFGAAMIALSLFMPPADARVFSVGSISNEPVDEIKEWIDFVRLLAAELKQDGIDGGQVVVAKSEAEMAGMLREGGIDLYIDSPLVSLVVARLSGSKPLVRRWKGGKAEYTSVLFTSADSPIRPLSDFRGRVIAFQDSFSTTGYMLPRLELSAAGVALVRLTDVRSEVPAGRAGFVFSGKDENTFAWVVRGRAAAGATSRADFDRLNRDGKLRVVFESPPIPRHIVSHRADLQPTLVARVREVLIGMHTTDVGRKALEKFERTSRFDDIPPEALAVLGRLEARLPELEAAQ